jgi:hypothetical protein
MSSAAFSSSWTPSLKRSDNWSTTRRCCAQTSRWLGWAKIERLSAATKSCAALGTLADRLCAKCVHHLTQKIRIEFLNLVATPLQCRYRVGGHRNRLSGALVTGSKRMVSEGLCSQRLNGLWWPQRHDQCPNRLRFTLRSTCACRSSLSAGLRDRQACGRSPSWMPWQFFACFIGVGTHLKMKIRVPVSFRRLSAARTDIFQQRSFRLRPTRSEPVRRLF